MGLQNIFDMVKADRYTQDGREEIIKAQNETEDARRTYKNGEISEKTGLMKTANGWVEPPANKGAERNHGVKKEKGGKGAIHTAGTGNVSQEKMKEAAEKGLKGEELKNFFLNKTEPSKSINEWEESAKTEAKHYNENMVVMQNAKGETTIIREGSPDIDKAENKGYKKMSLVRPDGSVKKHEENNKEFSDTENHSAKLEARKKADSKAKKEAAVKQERAEGEARARDFQKKVESGEIVYNKETGKFEDNPKAKEEPGRKLSNAEHNARIKKGISASLIDKGSRYSNENGAKIEVNEIEEDGSVNFSVRNPSGYVKTHEVRSKEELERILDVAGFAADSAPHTGDSKIRVRKS